MPSSRASARFRAAARNPAGFTLLEVMAAVALLGMVYVVLGGAGIQGLQHEGEAQRRLQASLLADRILEEIEAALEFGTAPPIGEQEREEGDFAISVAVAPFDLVLPEVETPRALERSRDRDRRPGEARREERELGPSLLVGTRGQPAPLRRIDVRVRWVEGWGERAVERTTFALDAQSVQEQIAALDAAADAAREGGAPDGRGADAQRRGDRTRNESQEESP